MILVMTTTGTADEAQRIGRELVERRLAACVQVDGPITSIYRWDGAVETSPEWRLTTKTRRESFNAVAAAIRELHSYQLPEIVAIDVAGASPEYRAWVEMATGEVFR